MKILTTTDIRTAEHRDGAIRNFFGIAAGLARRGHEVRVLLPRMDGSDSLRREFSGLDFNFFSASGNPRLKEISAALNCGREFDRCLCGGACDIVAFSQPKSAASALLLKGIGETPSVYHFLSPWSTEYELKTGKAGGAARNARRAIEKKILLRCNAIIVMSDYMKSELLALHPEAASKTIYKIPGGADTGRFAPAADRPAARAAVSFPKDRPVLFTSRNLTARTGIDILLEAMASVKSRRPDAFLSIGGSGDQSGTLKAKAASLGLGGCARFEGFIPDERLPLYFQAADIFVLPTRSLEGFGLVTVEALACGTPVIGTPVGATPELLRPLDPGFLSNAASPESLAERILFWLDRLDDLAARRESFRKYALDNFTWDKVAGMTENSYLEIIGGKR
ncbi:MAG: glycosyltransferase family 4 protein [bacterium]